MRALHAGVARWLRGALWVALLTAAPLPAAAVTLFGLVDTGELFSSADLGVSWSVRATLPVHDAVALVAGSTSQRLFLASASGSVYRSTDGGASWSAVAAVSAHDVCALVGCPDRLLLFTRSGSVYSSSDEGATWTAAGALTTSDLVSVTRHDLTLFALERTGGVHRSDDLGATWSAVGALDVPDAVEIAALRTDLFALTGTGDVARSGDDGANWTFVSTLSQTGMTSLLATQTGLVVCTATGEAAASADGQAWAWCGAIGQLAVRALASDVPATSGVAPEAPGLISLLGPWPNPSGAEVTLTMMLERAGPVTMTVHDAAGREVARPLAGVWLPAGPSVRQWRPAGLPAGAYWLRARMGATERVRTLIWLGR
jgi:hypothetical protein